MYFYKILFKYIYVKIEKIGYDTYSFTNMLLSILILMFCFMFYRVLYLLEFFRLVSWLQKYMIFIIIFLVSLHITVDVIFKEKLLNTELNKYERLFSLFVIILILSLWLSTTIIFW
jgi:hypothetical protein